jgi:hypothetical protein
VSVLKTDNGAGAGSAYCNVVARAALTERPLAYASVWPGALTQGSLASNLTSIARKLNLQVFGMMVVYAFSACTPTHDRMQACQVSHAYRAAERSTGSCTLSASAVLTRTDIAWSMQCITYKGGHESQPQ